MDRNTIDGKNLLDTVAGKKNNHLEFLKKLEDVTRKLGRTPVGGTKKEMHILLHVVKMERAANAKGKDSQKKLKREYYPYGELYSVDMTTGVVFKCPGGPLLEDDGCGSVVALGGAVYVIGCKTADDYKDDVEFFYDEDDIVDEDIVLSAHHAQCYVHSKASFLDLRVPKCDVGWKSAPALRSVDYRPKCVAFNGKIYSFGGTAGFVEVLAPGSLRWDQFQAPPELIPHINTTHGDRMKISSPVISDPKNNRILVHVYSLCWVLAYYPADDKWERLAEGLCRWNETTALVDNVLYSHVPDEPNPTIVAYDLSANKLLENVVFQSLFDDHHSLMVTEFDAMLNLDSGTLCLVAYTPDSTKLKTQLIFAPFKVRHDPGSLEAVVIPFPVQKSVLPFPCGSISHFLPYEIPSRWLNSANSESSPPISRISSTRSLLEFEKHHDDIEIMESPLEEQVF